MVRTALGDWQNVIDLHDAKWESPIALAILLPKPAVSVINQTEDLTKTTNKIFFVMEGNGIHHKPKL